MRHTRLDSTPARASRFALLAACLLALVPASQAAGNPDTLVRTDGGTLRGVADGDVLSFKGIPYAAPPVGPLRWRAPQPAARWRGERAADAFGNACIQPTPSGPGSDTGTPLSEDCLYLNVWTPATRATAPRPVMVWIHGGALVTGAASQRVYDGAAFARRGVVLVSINYRLGRLGFFAHPALTRENADGGRLGNYGLMDQVAALRWVQRNIRAFGGDPRRVTVFGESAGAASVLALMVTPEARGLFQRAISQSGYGRGSYSRPAAVAPDGQAAAGDEGAALLRGIGVDTTDAAVLRGLPLARLDALPPISQMTGANFLLDGQVLREDLWSAFRAGHEARVPLLIGANDQENAWPTPPEMKAARLKRFDRWVSPAERAQLVADYGGQDVFDGHFTGDLTFAAHAWSLAALHAVNGQPTWRYRFAALPDAARATLAGTPHAGELAYVFGNLGAAYWPTSARDAAVSAAVMDYWVEFARSGRPQPAGRPAWPRADADGVMLFEDDGPKPAARDDRTGRYRALGRYADPRS